MPRLRLDPFSPSGVSIVADSPRGKQQNGYVARTEKLSQISDVDATAPSNGQALAYDATSKTWRPTTISGGTGGGTTLAADAAGWLHDDGIGTLAWTTPAKSDVGLSNVDNTSDANKPVSTATQTALNGKENSITIGTSAQYYRGDKTMQTLNQDAVPSGTTNKAYTATEQTKLAAITGTNTGDQTLSIAGSNLTISGTNGNTVALPTGGTTSDATTTTKGIIELAGDLSGTAAAPTVPGLASKASLTGTETLTNKTLTAPKIDSIKDTNGVTIWSFNPVPSAVNYLRTDNNVAGASPTMVAVGTDANISVNVIPKGTGRIRENGTIIPNVSSADTLTNKTMSGASNTFSAIPESAVTNLTTDLAAKATDTAVVHLANAEAITGAKTFNSGSLVLKGATTGTTTLNATANALGTVTVPATTDTLVALNTTDTLTNKTLTSPTINTPIITQSVSSQTAAATLAIGSSSIQYANATTAAFTITLPTTTTAGISFTIVKVDSSANAVTVAGTINGATNYVLSTQWSYIQVVSTTTSGVWYIIDNSTANTAANVTGTVAIANGGTGSTTQNFVDLTTAQTVAGVKTFSSAPSSTVATGTAPLTVTSTTKVTNLNADQVDGFHANATATANNLLPLDANALVPRTALAFTTYIKMTAGSQALPASAATAITGMGIVTGNNPSGFTNTASGFTLPAGIYIIGANLQFDTTNMRVDVVISNSSAAASLNQQFGKASLTDMVILTTTTTFGITVTNNSGTAANVTNTEFTAVRIY